MNSEVMMFHEERGRKTRHMITAGVLALLALLCMSVSVTGCGDQYQAYRGKYISVMDGFQAKAGPDDKISKQLIENNDIGGLMTLIRNRISNIDQVVSKVMKLDPPSEYVRLHILTLSYLITLKDQFIAQNQLNEAILNGQPLTDLKSIAEKYVENTQFAGSELRVELQKIGVKLTGGTTNKPQTSGPSSSSTQQTVPQASTPGR